MSSWSLEAPQFLLLLILIPFGIYFRHVWPKRGGVLRFSFSVYKAEAFKKRISISGMLYVVSAVFFWAGMTALFIALAGPVRMSRDRVFLNRGIDIMFVLDLSPSMGATDFKPDNRFTSAKEVIRNFIDSRENDPVGIVTFGSEAALRVPPTLDYDLLKDRLDSFRIMEQGKETAIGMGIAIAVLHLKESTAREKVLILLTDGQNNAGDIMPESAADIAAKMGVKIYVVGIGSQGEVLVEYEDPETGKKFSGRTSQSYDEDLLQTIADISGGTFFAATSVTSLESIFNNIDSNESYEKKVKVNTFKEPMYRIFIILAFCFILADFFIRKVLLQEVLP
ncbi:MAG: VWA domain-containing protein [Spirochaetales bacterium]|nr:VWA domain-containing protein [Spirochaetales bacterium]